jgi:alkyl sulfatase BDS1-like metallo-beta-lactamase superfamily hydrolase
MQAKSIRLSKDSADNLKPDQAFQVILKSDVLFEEPHPDIQVAKIPIANATCINTGKGAVLIDTLLSPRTAKQMKKLLDKSGIVVKKIIYTHHHLDHVGGSTIFEKDRPEVFAHRYLPENMDKYKKLNAHQSRISSIQFNIPFAPGRVQRILEPTRLFDYSMSFSLGEKTFELYHARAETDDATWVYVPEIRTAVVGDLIIAGLPNIGNPYKPTRFALPWVKALEKIRGKKPELLIAHGGRAVYRGTEVKKLLDITIEAIHSLLDQVFQAINDDIPLDEMIHLVQLPEHLRNHEYLEPIYSRTEFAVFNIYRWYHGYFDHNPAHLLPRPDNEVNLEIVKLIGEKEKIVERAKALTQRGQHQLALQVLDIVMKQDSAYPGARELHLRILEALCADDTCLMSRNTFIYFIQKDKEILSRL